MAMQQQKNRQQKEGRKDREGDKNRTVGMPDPMEPTYGEGGKFGRQEGQIGSKGPAVWPARKQAIQHPHNKQQAQGGAPEEHPKGG
jgi:hypothetical protein